MSSTLNLQRLRCECSPPEDMETHRWRHTHLANKTIICLFLFYLKVYLRWCVRRTPTHGVTHFHTEMQHFDNNCFSLGVVWPLHFDICAVLLTLWLVKLYAYIVTKHLSLIYRRRTTAVVRRISVVVSFYAPQCPYKPQVPS
jgi:hypothetical protein